MSGYPSGSGDGQGLDNLFAQLRQSQTKKPVNLEPSYGYYNNAPGYFGQPPAPQPSHAYQQPSVSSAIPTPTAGAPPPHHSPAIASPTEIPQPRIPVATGGPSNADRTSSLLNLLKFSQPSGNSSSQPAPIGTPLPPSREASTSYAGSDVLGQVSASSHGRGGSDLLAALMGIPKPAQQASPQLPAQTQHAPASFAAPSPSADTQAYLLNLLNQPKPAQTDSTPQLKPTKILTPPGKASSQIDIGDLTQALENSSIDTTAPANTEPIAPLGKENTRLPNPKNAQGLFTYVNPFEQLAASSPRNRTPKNAGPVASSPAIQILKHPRHDAATDNKRKMDERSGISSPAHSKRKLEPASQGSTPPPVLPDGRTPVEALIGIGAAETKESVHAALNEVGDQANKQAQEAITRAEKDEDQSSIEQDLRDMLAARTDKEFETTAQVAAKAIKKELEKDDNSGALDSLPEPVAEAVKDIIDDAAQGHIADSWESADAEDSPVKEEEEGIVKVYNFPMRPWTSIKITDSDESRPFFRDEAVLDVARLKKEFDQVDRTLVTASNNFIVYGMSKNGGFRIIRQDDGKDTRLFTETHDRIFNIATSVSAPDLKETIIGTGLSGTVFWAVVKDGEGDHIEDGNLEMCGFALPPIQSQEIESPGGVLKTRARSSSSHPDFFAVGRGKFIYVVWPSVITKHKYLKQGKERLVDIEKYLANHSLKINTGKAGKDFTFSQDDSTIVSLDKAGKVKFWDVRSLTNILGGSSVPQNIEIVEPLATFPTTPMNEKSWPTSVLLVDKLRPYQRGGALRYLVVGMKQNHTLQLWDLALQKPVQEIHLPHSKESDAVCSVLYHASTGMIVVGHPTRNSVYMLHLSAPKYNLPKSITQAEYMQKLMSQDTSIAKPESTAVISGMREYFFGNKGMLRSLDILQTPNSSTAPGESATLFELYAMHSKGVTCLSIKSADLGWTSENKVIHPVVADKAGIITIDTLKELPVTLAPETTEAPSAPSAPTRIVPRPSSKESAIKEPPKKAHKDVSTAASKGEDKLDLKELNGALPSGSPEKTDKKKKRKGTIESSGATQSSQQSKSIVPEPLSQTRNGGLSKANANSTLEPNRAATPSTEISEAILKSMESRITGQFKKLLGDSFDSLHRDIKDERRAQTAVGDAKQDAMLRLVSSTLADNVESTLGRIVSRAIEMDVLPAVSEASVKHMNKQLGPAIKSHLDHSIPKELQKVLPDAIKQALHNPQLLKLMSDSLAQSVAFRVEEQFANLLHTVITPAFSDLTAQATQRVAAEAQRKAAEQSAVHERQRQVDNVKIEQLTQLVTGLTETVSSMAAAQSEFQAQFLRMQQQAAADRQEQSRRYESSVSGQTARASNIERPSTTVTASGLTPEEAEYQLMFNSITSAMEAGDYENAVIQWLQTRREQEFFDNYFSKYNPDFLRDLSPLLLLSLGATISIQLEGLLINQRIAWMETILVTFQGHVTNNTLEDQVRDLIPKITGIYIQRVEHLFMRISQVAGNDPILKRLQGLVNAANRIQDSSGMRNV